MPTQYNIVNGLADLEILEYRGAVITQTIGGKDLSDQRILEIGAEGKVAMTSSYS